VAARRPVVLIAAVALAGCVDAPPPEPVPIDPAEANRRAAELYTPPAAELDSPPPASGPQSKGGQVTDAGGAQIGAEPVQVVLVWEGISRLHQSFFSDTALTTQLSAELTGEVLSPANIYVRYNAEAFTGSIRLQLLPDSLERSVRRTGDTIVLQDLAPITTALAGYRSGVAGKKDFRIESFKIGVESVRGARGCIFGVAGSPPPDGRLVSPCVEVNGRLQCGEPGPDGVRFAPKVADDIAACLDL
jgi:hypothetical protein